MCISPNGRVALRELMEQAWQQVEGQARGMLKRAVEGLLQAERDRRVSEAKQRGEKVYRWGYTGRKCWTTLWGGLEQVRVPRLRRAGRKRSGWGDAMSGRVGRDVVGADGGRTQSAQGGGLGAAVSGRDAVATTIGAVLEQAREQVEQRRSAAIAPGRYRAIVVDGIYLRYRRSVSQPGRQGVLLVAVGVREGGGFEVLDWRAASAKPPKTMKSC